MLLNARMDDVGKGLRSTVPPPPPVPLTDRLPVTSRSPKICVFNCVKESLPAPFTMMLDDKPGMLMLMSVVVREAHDTALVTAADDAVIAPPMVADDALRGPQAMSPCSVVLV